MDRGRVGRRQAARGPRGLSANGRVGAPDGPSRPAGFVLFVPTLPCSKVPSGLRFSVSICLSRHPARPGVRAPRGSWDLSAACTPGGWDLSAATRLRSEILEDAPLTERSTERRSAGRAGRHCPARFQTFKRLRERAGADKTWYRSY